MEAKLCINHMLALLAQVAMCRQVSWRGGVTLVMKSRSPRLNLFISGTNKGMSTTTTTTEHHLSRTDPELIFTVQTLLWTCSHCEKHVYLRVHQLIFNNRKCLSTVCLLLSCNTALLPVSARINYRTLLLRTRPTTNLHPGPGPGPRSWVNKPGLSVPYLGWFTQTSTKLVSPW